MTALAEEINALLDAGDLRGALIRYIQDMPVEILEIVRQVPGMVDQAGSLRADADSLVWAESAPHAQLFGSLDIPVLALIGEHTYDIMRPAADSIAAAVPGAQWKSIPGAEHTWQPQAMVAELSSLVASAGSAPFPPPR